MTMTTNIKVGVDSVELMGRAIELIVVCAQMNEHFSFMYAELCRKITDKWSSGTENEVRLFLFLSISFNLLFQNKMNMTYDSIWEYNLSLYFLISLYPSHLNFLLFSFSPFFVYSS